MPQKFGALSLLLALIGFPLSIILALLVWSRLVWLISGVLAIIIGIVGLKKDDPTTISIIGIIFGIFSFLWYIIFYNINFI